MTIVARVYSIPLSDIYHTDLTLTKYAEDRELIMTQSRLLLYYTSTSLSRIAGLSGQLRGKRTVCLGIATNTHAIQPSPVSDSDDVDH